MFLLVGVIDGRYFVGLQRREPFDRFLLRGMLVLTLSGEAAALATLALSGDEVLLRGLVLLAIGCTGMLLWIYAVVGPARPTMPTDTLAMAERVRRAVEDAEPR